MLSDILMAVVDVRVTLEITLTNSLTILERMISNE
jgi:hypothetical protein